MVSTSRRCGVCSGLLRLDTDQFGYSWACFSCGRIDREIPRATVFGPYEQGPQIVATPDNGSFPSHVHKVYLPADQVLVDYLRDDPNLVRKKPKRNRRAQ